MDPFDNPSGTEAAPLSLEDAAAAYANLNEADEPDTGQSEAESDLQGDEAGEPLDDDVAGETEEDGQAEDEPEVPQYVADDAKLKLDDGRELTVSALKAELKDGTLRLQDYRRKTEEVAAERKAVVAKSEQIQQFEQQLHGDREFLIELTQSLMPQKPDPSMYAIDPIGYGEQKLAYDTRKEHLDYLLSVKQHLTQKATAEQEEQLKETRQREWQRTLEKMPELKDSQRLQSFVGEINKHASEYEFTPQEIQQIGLDHRQVLVLRDAIKWRNLQASKSKVAAKVEGRPPVQRGGTRQAPEAQRTRDAKVAMDRLKSTGSLRDGVAALLASEKG